MAKPETGIYNASILDGVTTTGASSAYDCTNYSMITFQIIAASVTTGGTMLIQSSLDGTNWGTISTTAVSANGSTIVSISQEKHRWIRANLSARTDGTYTVHMIRGN